MSYIPTWHERVMAHSDHQSGTISEDMIRAGMDEEISDLRAEVERLRAERDTLLLDARDFVRWFNRHHPDPSRNPDHPWCVINDRLNAHAETLATLDAGVKIKEENEL